MTARFFITQFLTVCLVCLAGIGLFYAGLRDDRLPPGIPPAIDALAPRCYALDLSAVSTYLGDLPHPLWVHLLPAQESKAFLSGWYAARRPATDLSIARHRLPIVEQPHWRPAGKDSLDIIFPSFPMLLLLRLPAHDTLARGRALVSDDVGGLIDLPDLWPVGARRIGCQPGPS